jgi:hypothetical protein
MFKQRRDEQAASEVSMSKGAEARILVYFIDEAELL